MSHTDFLSGIHEKLPLDGPYIWDTQDFPSNERTGISHGNTALEKTFDETKTDLPKLIAHVRWSIFGKSVRDFADEAGMSVNGYKPMEDDVKESGRTAVHRSKYTKLLELWKEGGISSGIREQLLDLLLNPEFLKMDESCTDLLSSIDFMRKQSLDLLNYSHIGAFYHRVGYELGHEKVEAKFPSFFNTVWQREKTKTVPTFQEIQNFVETMYAERSNDTRQEMEFRMNQAEALWTEARKNQYKTRTIEPSMATYLTLAEKYLAKEHQTTLTALSLRDILGHTPLYAERLLQTEFVPVQIIQENASVIMDPHDRNQFLTDWSTDEEQDQRRETFGKLYSAAMDERGFSYADIARLIGVKAPEERGVKVDRTSRFRPDSEVRGLLFQHHGSNQISVEAMIQIAATNPEQADMLRDSYYAESERHYRRMGYTLHGDGLKMRITRELANVNMSDLALHFLPKNQQTDAKIIRAKNLELQKLERQEGKQHVICFKEVFPILEQIASERAAEALARLSEFHDVDETKLELTTVQNMAEQLIVALKGAKAVSSAMRDSASHDSLWLRSELITSMAEDSSVYTLPALRLMAKSTVDRTLPKEVIRDWYEKFPEQLQTAMMHFGTVRKPLARVLCTLIATKDANPIQFFKNRVPGGAPTAGTRHLSEIEAGNVVEWKYIHKYLIAVPVEPEEPAYLLAKALHDNFGDVHKALTSIVPILRERNIEIHPSNLPGLTLKELESFRPSIS